MTEFWRVTEARLVQLEKQEKDMLVTELGMVIALRPLQSWKLPSENSVRDSGRVMEVRLVQPLKQ